MNNSIETTSYSIKNFTTNVEAELKRLKAQVELFWQKEVSVYKQFGMKDGLDILECGSGTGFLMEKIISQFPNCRITGVEPDPLLVDISREYLREKGLEGCEIVNQSMTTMDFPDNSFDLVVTRMVLEHIPNPEGAAKEVRRVLKPHGIAIFVDNDFAMHLRTFPDIPELDDLFNAYCKARVADGGNPCIGRELPGIMKKCGFIDVGLEVVVAHSEIVGDETLLSAECPGISAKLVEDGYLSGDNLDLITRKWYEMLQTENHAICRQIYIAGGRKGKAEKSTKKEHLITGDTQKSENVELGDILKIDGQERKIAVENYIADLIATTLMIKTSMLERGRSLFEYGFDSIKAVQVKTRIDSDLKVDIPVVEFFENLSVSDLTSRVFEMIQVIEKTSAEAGAEISGEGKGAAEVKWDEGEI